MAGKYGNQIFMENRKILIAGGGTGGHLFPALAIGEEIIKRNSSAQVHYIGSSFGLEAKVFPIKDVWHTLIPIRGLQRGFNLKGFCRNILLPFRIIKSLIKTKKLFDDFVPELIIGTGGYASAIPLLLALKQKNRVPIILQEQNSFPGITTRLFAKRAKLICIAFKESTESLLNNTVITGNPIRLGINSGIRENGLKEFGLQDNIKTIFLFGGSQGSSYLNKLISKIIEKLSGGGLQLLWQTGDLEYRKYKKMESSNIRIIPFINNMADAYAISDLLICRSGALTISEITVCGKPAILVPFPHAAGDHQTKNAQSLEIAGAAKILTERELTPNKFAYTIMSLIHDNIKLHKMGKQSFSLGKPNATKDIVNQIFNTI